MRGVFAALVVCNLLLAGWLIWGGQAAGPVSAGQGVAPVSSAGNIVLLREAPAVAGVQEAASSVPVAAVNGRPAGADTAIADSVIDSGRVDPVAMAPEVSALCTLVGAFPELLRAEYLVEHLAALNIVATVESLEVAGDPGYWVYLEPAISKMEALRSLRELQDKGLDTYLIPKGDLTNGISFGLFSVKARAEDRAVQLQAQGYPVKVGEMQRTYKETWVQLQPQEAAKIDEPLWQKLLADGDKLEMRQNFCAGVAHP